MTFFDDNPLRRLLRAATLPALFAIAAAIAYLAGAFSSTFRTFPYPQLLERPVRAARAYSQLADKLDDVHETSLWQEVRLQGRGVVHHSPDAHEGYTFLTRSHESAALLLDMHGEILHRWELPFHKAWPDPPHTDRAIPDSHINWRRAKLFPDGDVLALYTTVADSPYGYGLVRIDRNSEIVWKYAANAHHDFTVGDDGSIYTVVQRYRDTADEPVDGMPQLPRLTLTDSLVRLDADGRERQRIDLLELIADSEYRHLLQMYAPGSDNPANSERTGDVLHTNAVTVLDEPFTDHHAFADPGDILLSFRPLDAIAVVSVDDERLEWMTRGFWSAQHDPDPLPNGHILLFDNQGSGTPGGISRILEFDPADHAIAWKYEGTDSRPFQSITLGAQERLPNGHTLITSSKEGRVFEVDPTGEIVWEYLNPARHRDGDLVRTSAILEATRFAPETLEFDFDPPS